jgi:hypothetical protein
MSSRRAPVLAALVVVGLALTAGGVLLVAGSQGGPRVAGIVAAVLGLACLRAASWARKVRRLTQVGLDLHRPADEGQTPGETLPHSPPEE